MRAEMDGVVPTVPPSQARKNKKVRKLLQEGVPSSVHYLIWCYLTDSKVRALLHTQVRLTECEQLMEKVMVLPRVHCVTGSVTYLE